ncbi:MAG: hypothetical protein ACRBN8_27340 [Nannocystales bacterium]
MECFASNAAVDSTQIRVLDPGFGPPAEPHQRATIRVLLRAEEAEHRLGELFTRFMEEVRGEHERGDLEEAYLWTLQGSTQLHSNLALSLRIFRELLPHAFLMTLFGPGDTADRPRYLIHELDELRAMNGNLVFTAQAWVCEREAKTDKLEHP